MEKRFPRRFNTTGLLLFTLLAACSSVPGTGPWAPEIPRSATLIPGEIVALARFNDLKITGEITLALDDSPLVEQASTVLYLAPPGQIRLRIYRVGIPVLDLLYKDNKVWSRPEADASTYQALVYGIVPALYWWRNVENAEMISRGGRIMFRTPRERVWVDRNSLLPLLHEFASPAGPVRVQYSGPRLMSDSRPFQSHIAVAASSYTALITISKMAVDEGIRPELFVWASD